MVRDPILAVFQLFLLRLVLFATISFLLSIGVFYGELLLLFGGTYDLATTYQIWSFAWPPSISWGHELLLMSSVAIGTLSTIIVFLILSFWWQRRGAAVHRRGSHIIDQRGEL